MKILIITSVYGMSGGGAGIVVEQLAQGLAARDWKVGVITLGKSNGLRTETSSGVSVIRLSPLNLYDLTEKDQHPVWQRVIWQIIDIFNPVTAWELRNIFQKERPDIIHIHKMRGLSGAVWTVSSRICPGQVIQTCHDFESMSPAGTLQGRIGRWALEGKWPIRWYQAVRAHLSRKISWLTAPSTFTLTTIAKSGLFPFAQCSVVPNTHGWTSSELDRIREHAKYSKKVHLLYLGRLEPEKGLRELFTAFCLVAPRYPELYLTIAGWGVMEAELRQTYGSRPDITFASRVYDKEKSSLLSSVSALIVPSICLESSPLVVLEAYAYGKPVIVSRIGGLSELVREGETGWLVEPANTDALAQAIEAAAQNPGRLQKMSLACFDKAKEFTIEKMVDQFESIYLNLK